MLADDEGIVIDSLKFIINKEFPGECEIEFARTGRNVIELADTFRPDIAVMDIQMPGINGIEAMREIRKTNSNVIFIVMSAYDKFDYAQEAIKLGAIEYITKPMNKDKMVATLSKAMKMVATARDRRSNELMVREKLETVVPIIENGFISNILFHEYFDEDIENYKTMLDCTATNGFMMVLVCGDTLDGNHMTNAVGSSVKLQKQYKEIRDLLKDYFNCYVGSVMANKIAVLIPYEASELDYSERSTYIERARELADKLAERTDIKFRIGFGRVKELRKLEESYREAVDSLVMTKNTVAHADDLPIGCAYTEDYPVNLEKRFFDEVEKGRTDAAVDAALDYFKWVITQDIMDAKLKVLEFALRAEKSAYESGGMTYRLQDRRDYLPTIMGIDTQEALWNWFRERVLFSCSAINTKRDESSNDVIDASKKYIENNYTKNINLEDVSREVNISSYYLSRIFKESTGVNFIDYLTNLRVEKAKELLSSTNLSMKEVATKAGYADPNYFSKLFKKIVGVTPTEYREGK